MATSQCLCRQQLPKFDECWFDFPETMPALRQETVSCVKTKQNKTQEMKKKSLEKVELQHPLWF